MSEYQTATFAAGCFWGVEAAFRETAGVVDAVSGYTGGTTPNPSYREVCGGATGHAEAVLVTYDPDRVVYSELLRRFWEMHDPTTRDRQGPDVGTQYRSAIFVHDEQQRAQAEGSRTEEQARYGAPIVTEIVAAGPFYPAEAYHQRYFERHGAACHVQR